MADDLFANLLPVRNRGVFSSHCSNIASCSSREWHEQADAASDALHALEDLWKLE